MRIGLAHFTLFLGLLGLLPPAAAKGAFAAGETLKAPEALRLTAPLEYAVVQRRTRTRGAIVVAGEFGSEIANSGLIQTKLSGSGAVGRWQTLGTLKRGERSFRFELIAPAGGWYRLEVRLNRDQAIIANATIDHVGVGEVFVVAGQSNSANHGADRQQTATGLVANFSGQRWLLADDPQPGASGVGGSFMPPFGDGMARQFQVPIGIVAAGVGATSVREWLPAGVAFPNPPTLTNRVHLLSTGDWSSDGTLFEGLIARLKAFGPHGFRALLWHQGESDANQQDPTRTLSGEEYRREAELLIGSVRREAGWDFPWFVAQTTYHAPDDAASPDIRAAQAALWQEGLALQGPDTDKLGSDWRDSGGKGVHFNGAGLRAHAGLWVDQVAPWLEAQIATE